MTISTTVTDYDGGEVQIIEVTTGPTGRAVEVLTGTTQPNNSQGSNGDLYLVTSGQSLGDMYKKVTGWWQYVGNLRGPGINSVNGRLGPDVVITASDIVSGTLSITVLPVGQTQYDVARGNHRHDNLYEPVLPTPTQTNTYLTGEKTWDVLDKSAVGLTNVDNTSDLLKPISYATRDALDQKASVLHTHSLADDSIYGILPVSKLPIGTSSGTVAAGDHTHTPSSIGAVSVTELQASSLANRDRANHHGTQPASTITGLSQVALTGSASDLTTGTLPLSVIPDFAIPKVYTVSSEAAMLALNAQEGDIAIRTDQERSYVLGPGVATTFTNWKELGGNSVRSVAGKKGIVTLDKSDVGLYNVDNTSDAAKPISTATQSALDGKASASHGHDGSHINSGVIDVARLPIAGASESSASKVVLSNDPRLTNARTALPHNHDERYYPIDQMQVLLNNKANLNHQHEMEDIDQLNYTLGTFSQRISAAGTAAGNATDIANGVQNQYNSLQPQVVSAAQLAQTALEEAGKAFTYSDTKNKTFFQNDAPTTGMKSGDLWVDTDNDMMMHVYGPNGWISTSATIDTEIEAAILVARQKAEQALSDALDAFNNANTAQDAADAAREAALAAQAAAEGSLRTYYQSEPPWPNNSTQPDTVIGDLWFDLDTDVSHRWTGTEWRVIQDDAVSDALARVQALEQAVPLASKIYIQSAAPAGRAQDLWIDTTNGANTPKRWVNNAWTAVTDRAALDAAQAVTQLGGRVDGLQGSITTQNSRIATLEGDMSSVESEIVTERGRITTVANNLSNTNATISNHNTRLNSLDGLVTTVRNDVDTTFSNITQINTNINGLTSSVAAIQTSKNKITYSTAAPVAEAQQKGDIWFQRDANKNIVAQFEGTGLTGAAGWQKVQLSGAVLTNLDAGTITTGILSAEVLAAAEINTALLNTGGLNAAAITVGKVKASQIDTTGLIIQSSNVQGLQSLIDDSLDLARDYADSIELGAINLFDGGRDPRGGTSRLITIPVRNVLAPLVNESVSVSFDIMATAAGTVSVYGYEASGISIDGNFSVPVTTQWVRHNVVTTAKAFPDLPGKSTGEIAFNDTANANNKLSLRNIKIEKGNRPTAYSPTQKDIDDAIALAKSEAAAAGEAGAVEEMKTIWGHTNNSTLIDGGKIFTNSIKTTSLQAADWTEYMTGSDWDDTVTRLWNLPASFSVDSSVTYNGRPTLKISGSSTGTATRPTIKVVPGESYHIEFYVRKDASWNGTPNMSKLRFANANGGAHLFDVTYGSANIPNTTEWHKRELNWTAPAGVTDLAVTLNEDASAGTIWLSNVSMRRRFGAEVLIDGTLRTEHFHSTGIDAEIIKSGFLDGDRIEAGSIGASKLLVQAGGGNLFDNSSFMAPAPRPGNFGSATVTEETSTIWTGTKALRVTASTSGGGAFGTGFGLIHNEVIGASSRIKPKTKYVASAWVYNPSSGGVKNINLGASGSAVVTNVGSGFKTTKNEWFRVDCYFETGVSGQVSLLLTSEPDAADANKYFILGAIQLTEGDIPTSYRPKAQELLPGTIRADMLDADAINGKVMTGGTFQTTAAVNKGVKINTAGIVGYSAASTAQAPDPTFSLNATNGELWLKGELRQGSTINNTQITGVLQTHPSDVNEGIKITSTGMKFYKKAAGSTPAQEVLTFDSTSGSLLIRGTLTAGTEIIGPTITLGGSPIPGYTPVFQTETGANKGIKINSQGLLAYDGVSTTPTFSLSASTGTVAMKGTMTAGSNINGATITGGLIRTAASGGRAEITTDQGGSIRIHPGRFDNIPAYIHSGETPQPYHAHTWIILTSPSYTGGTVVRSSIALEGWKGLNGSMHSTILYSADGAGGGHHWLVNGAGRVWLNNTDGFKVQGVRVSADNGFTANAGADGHAIKSYGTNSFGGGTTWIEAAVIGTGGGNAVVSPSIVNTPSSGGAAVKINTSNSILFRDTSGLQHKVDVKPLELNGRSVLNIVPITYRSKVHVERHAAGDKDWQHEPPVEIGFSAESFIEAGFEELVQLDKEGKPDYLSYDRITALLAAETKQKFDEMEEIIRTLQAEVAALKNR